MRSYSPIIVELHEVSFLANPAYSASTFSSRASNANTNNPAARRRIEAAMCRRQIPLRT